MVMDHVQSLEDRLVERMQAEMSAVFEKALDDFRRVDDPLDLLSRSQLFSLFAESFVRASDTSVPVFGSMRPIDRVGEIVSGAVEEVRRSRPGDH